MGIHRKKEDFLKKKMYCITFSVTHNGVSVIITRVIITVKDKPWISLVKLVVSITYPLFLAKREILLKSLFLEGRYFGGHYFWHLLTPAKFYRYFRRVTASFGKRGVVTIETLR